MDAIFTNARLVTENGIVEGTLVARDGVIITLDSQQSAAPGAIDLEGDYLAPGLIEMHTDNMERHFLPRPGVRWPDGLSAALTHDAQMAAAGVTTVYDAICVGIYDQSDKAYRRDIYGSMVEAVRRGVEEKLFRIDHRIHLRCELSNDTLMGDLELVADDPLVHLASLMDHTPGQRQWRNVEHLKTYSLGVNGVTVAEFERNVADRMARGPQAVQANWDRVVTLFAARGIPIATHDDTTEDHVADAVASGARISEFPTTLEAAHAAKRAGLGTVAGAPNIVRGGSHSGGVAVHELAAEGVLDGLSSDYVPASLLQAVGRLARDLDRPLHETFGLVSWQVADMLGLSDRGRIAEGLRADLVRFRFAGETPIVRGVWSKGERVL